MLDRGALPLLRRQVAVDPLAGVAVLADLVSAPDLHAGIEFGVQDAVPALAGAADRGRIPQPALGARHAFSVQSAGDLSGGVAGGVGREDPPDDLGLGGNDLDVPAGLGAVAIEPGAGGAPLLGVRTHPALGLGREHLDVLGRHEALERHLHPRDALARQGGNEHACGREAVVNVPLVLFVPGDPVLVFH
nr:hypothetical protein [Phenylobacterium sp.]